MSESIVHGKKLFGPARVTYLRYLDQENIPTKNRAYYVIRLNEFLQASSSRNPAVLNKHDISQVLNAIGRSKNLHDWQFTQLVDAVRIYIVYLVKSTAAQHRFGPTGQAQPEPSSLTTQPPEEHQGKRSSFAKRERTVRAHCQKSDNNTMI